MSLPPGHMSMRICRLIQQQPNLLHHHNGTAELEQYTSFEVSIHHMTNMINLAVKPIVYLCLGATINRVLHQVLPPNIESISNLNDVNNFSKNNKPTKQDQRKPKLADGCRHVFLDVGSNIGVHARMLLEPHLYPPPEPKQKNSKKKFSARDFFYSIFGPESQRDNTQYCIFAFEPNPAHVPRHKEMESAYAAMGWRYHFIQGGVGDEDGTLTFYHIGKGDKLLERGFTTVKSRCRQECREEEVKVYRLSDWIEEEVHGRIIPEVVDNDNENVDNIDSYDHGELVSNKMKNDFMVEKISVENIPPRVVMKMDIEMGEWLVFPDLLTSGVLCRAIDVVLGEFHLKSHEGDYPIRFENRGNWTLESYEEAAVLKDEMFGMVERNPNCRTKLVVGDDESYGQDGMPWPEPAQSSVI